MDRLWRLVYKLASRVRDAAWMRGQLWQGCEQWNTYEVTYTYTEPSGDDVYMIDIDPTTTTTWSMDPSWVSPDLDPEE